MVIEQDAGFRLGNVSCSFEVKELLQEACIPQDELLRFHLLPPNPKLQADHQLAIAEKDWICSSFELKAPERTIWIVTTPDQKSTNLYLEP